MPGRYASRATKSVRPYTRKPVADRFWPKVRKTSTCWVWTASQAGKGYGVFWDGVRQVYAHRFAFESVHGTIEPRLQIDHLCRVHNCVNPEHLEVVTNRENVLRGQHPSMVIHRAQRCARGHPYTTENVSNRTNDRHCRICQSITKRERLILKVAS